MAREVPAAERESRPPRQGPTRLDRIVPLRSQQVFRIHLYERKELVFVGVWGADNDAKTFALEVAAVCNLSHHQTELDLHRGHPGYHGRAAEP